MSEAGKSLFVTPAVLRDISSHAEADYPHETCGVLIGSSHDRRVHVSAIYPLRNVHPDNPERRYLGDHREYMQAEKESERLGLRVVGLYHSHPDTAPKPSSIDSEFAFPGWVYWIERVDDGVAGEKRAWLRSDDASSWSELNIES